MFQASSYLYWGLWTVADNRKLKSDSSVRTIVSPVGRNLPGGIVSETKIRFPEFFFVNQAMHRHWKLIVTLWCL